MKIVSIFDTTISDYNLGNQIIMDSVYKHLRNMFPNAFFFKLPYMEITRHTIRYIKQSNLIFFGGTNMLTGQMERYKQWGVSVSNFYFIRDVILMGVGWWQYQTKISFYTKFILNMCLSKKYIHSVRDSYTEKKLRELGFKNVLNTGCPTLWNLTDEHCKKIKRSKAEHVIITFTDYNKNPVRDKRIFDVAVNHYNKVYIFLQGVGDYNIINELNIKGCNVEIIPPNLDKYDEILSTVDADYIGTRLHAGIRALQYKKRAFIVGIDNRALEMKKDFNLPVIPEWEIDTLPDIINSDYEIRLNIPTENIIKWKQQFKDDKL